MAKTRTRSLGGYAASVVAAGALLVGAGQAAGAQASPALTVKPTIYFNLTAQCTFTIENDEGAQITPSTPVPPGTYDIEVVTPLAFGESNLSSGQAANDDTYCRGFELSLRGPNVNAASTLPAGCDTTVVLRNLTFAPSSTYTAFDTFTRTTFTTAATGTPPIPAIVITGITIGKETGTERTLVSPVGEDLSTHHFSAVLSANGHAELLGPTGHRVASLPDGNTVILVDDLDAKATLYLQETGSPPIRLTPPRFIGHLEQNVQLAPGFVKLYVSPHGAVSVLTVVS